ncbi:hypothetical protein MARI_06390 [Marinobacter sp. JH2]|nr:hypothetical protein MARI_06390 [Marinobacter sp. JH2]
MGQSPDSSTVNEINSVGMPFLQGNAEFGDKHPSPKYSCIRPPRVGETGATLISVRAPVGQTNIADRDYCIGRGLAAVKAREYGPALCRAIMAYKAVTLKKVSQGTTFEAISRDDLLSLQVPRIPNAEANLIESVLDILDTQIQKTEALIAKLEKIKEGLLHDLLTRGIDHNGQLRPMQEQAPELYKESALGLIPREWDVSELGTVTTSSVIGPFGSDLVASDYRSEGVPVVFVRDIAGARYNRVSRVFVSHKKALALSAHEVKAGDLLLTKMGLPPCISAVYPENEPAGIITADIVRLRLNAAVTPKWAQYFVNSEYVKAQVRGITAGVTRPKVTLKDVRSLKIAIPSTEEQARILDILQHCSKRLGSERAELSKLQSQKPGLMDDLLTGRVRVTPLLKDAV